MRNHPNVVKRMSSTAPGDCAVSTITSYELHTGIARCERPAAEQAKLDLLLRVVTELSFDECAAREAGQIRSALEAKGRMIGPYDVLLAGQALAAGLTLITNNASEFSRVAGLTIEDWQNE